MKKFFLILILTLTSTNFSLVSALSDACKSAMNYGIKGDGDFEKSNYFDAIGNYLQGSQLSCNDNDIMFSIFYNLGLSYGKLGDNKPALNYFKKSFEYAADDADKVLAQIKIKDFTVLVADDNLKTTSATNDPYSYKQYYLRSLNIVNAWEKITNSKEVIVAVIDDGIWINADDIKNNIWVDHSGSQNTNRVIDFVGDGLSNFTSSDHGTMVAGIIGAETNNKIGVAGIAKNVKIMSLRVFGTGGDAKPENIVNAINFAVDHGANIINLSVGESQFYLGSEYEDAIKHAYEKGVIVVIAAGNGDFLSLRQRGLDTTINPIQPVCNNGGGSKMSFGVSALKQDGTKAEWSNYGSCTSFWLPGEDIVSISTPIYNDGYGYNKNSGTSFSAPILSGIIALGYNKYGYVPFEIIKSELENSIGIFSYPELGISKDVRLINAEKYLDNLGKRLSEIKSAQDALIKKQTTQSAASIQKTTDSSATQKNDSILIANADATWKKLKTKYDRIQNIGKRKKTYEKLYSILMSFRNGVMGDKSVILERLILNVNEQILSLK